MNSQFEFAIAALILAVTLGWAFAPLLSAKKSGTEREHKNES